MRENRLRFSIRKLTIGTVSVMFGAVIFGLSANQVQAATNEDNSAQTSEVSDSSNVASETAENSTTASEKASAKTQENIFTEKVNDDTTAAESQKTQQVDEAHQTPHTGEDFNKKYQEDIPPVIVPKNDKQNSEDTILKDANGTTTQATISSTNKNTGKTASAKAGNSIENVFIDTTTASNTEVTYTVNNPTDSSQNISIFTELPAFNGTHALIKVDSDRLKRDADGNIVFGGDYAQKGLTFDNFDLATGKDSSSGFGRSIKEASENPALIGGFQITGTLAAGESASFVVPIKLNGTGDENGIVREKIGYFFGGGSDTRQVNVVTNLNLQKDKHYFLVDVNNSDTTHFRSISQTVLNALAKDGLSPLYQDGDIKFNSTNWFGTIEAQQSNDQPIFENDYIDISGAQNRLRSILNKYGYDIVGLGNLTGISNGSGYVLKSNYNYYDAQGNKIQLGTGNISNFMIGVKQVIALKDHQAPILNVNDSNYKTELDNLFTDPSDSGEELTVDSSSVEISKPGVYQVKVSNATGNISRTYNVIVAAYNNPVTTRVGEPDHKDISAEDMISSTTLQDLKKNGYTVSFATEPSYTVAGQMPVELIITDADGNTYKTTQDINIEQTVHVNLVNEAGKTVASTYKNGTVGTTDQLNLLSELPEGYALAQNENSMLPISFTADNAPIEVNVVQLKNESKTFTRTIHYQYEDGKTAADAVEQSVVFTRKQILDKDGHAVWGAWNKDSEKIPAVPSPTIKGYTPNMAEVKAENVTPEMANGKGEVLTVIYVKNAQPAPVEPTQPTDNNDEGQPSAITPDDQVQPSNSTATAPVKPEVSDQSQSDSTEKANSDDSTRTAPVKANKVEKKAKKSAPAKKNTQHTQNGVEILPAKLNKRVEAADNNTKPVSSNGDAKQLPQTGESKADAGLIGLALASLGLFGLASDRKRKN